MCNVFRTLHGGCAAYIVDPYVFTSFRHITVYRPSLRCSMSALVVLGIQHGFDGTGMSQSMNLIWHRAIYGSGFSHLKYNIVSLIHSASSGTQIKIVSTAIYTRGRVRTITCEVSQARLLRLDFLRRIVTPCLQIWDKDLNELCISATHSTVNASAELNDAKL